MAILSDGHSLLRTLHNPQLDTIHYYPLDRLHNLCTHRSHHMGTQQHHVSSLSIGNRDQDLYCHVEKTGEQQFPQDVLQVPKV